MPELNAVVDLSHHNGADDLNKAKNDGIIGIIHKATKGTGYIDPTYQTNMKKAGAEVSSGELITSGMEAMAYTRPITF